MFFIYPASVSENCDKRIVPAVAKCIERFFLLQLQDAVATGVLPLSRKYVNNKNYGPILLECLNNYNKKQMLVESKILQEVRDPSEIRHHSDPWNRKSYENIQKELDSIAVRIKSSDPSQYGDIAKDIQSIIDQINTGDGGKYKHLRSDEHESIANRIDSLLNQMGQNEDKLRRDALERTTQDRQDAQYELQKAEYELKKSREEREREIYNTEKEKSKSKAGTGSYEALDSKIDIVPTSATVITNVLYKGGPLHGKVMEDVAFNINVKVIPTIIRNFKELERDLLNDYFTKKSESYFRSKGRNIARMCYNKLKSLPCGIGDAIWGVGMKIAGKNPASDSNKDIIYNTQGFVNASAFHKTGNSPNNYNYTSNIVIFNKDDLTDPDDANIFQNRSAMVRLFKNGWSTFCMLDPVEEMMYFISSIDGGYMHYIPYRYMMESYGSKSYYGTETKLKDSVKPFSIKRGNFATFAKQFRIKRRK